MYTYKVVEIREKLLGGKMSGERLENLLNEQARQGWRLKAITSAEVKGRLGPGGVDGLLATFERQDGRRSGRRQSAAAARSYPGDVVGSCHRVDRGWGACPHRPCPDHARSAPASPGRGQAARGGTPL